MVLVCLFVGLFLLLLSWCTWIFLLQSLARSLKSQLINGIFSAAVPSSVIKTRASKINELKRHTIEIYLKSWTGTRCKNRFFSPIERTWWFISWRRIREKWDGVKSIPFCLGFLYFDSATTICYFLVRSNGIDQLISISYYRRQPFTCQRFVSCVT